ncbi:Uncharacterised protein [uncultured archaeon]|nr:Uncharacterised protein [uncultured archaeon]
MKIHKISSEQKKEYPLIDRKTISKIGESLYLSPEVKGVRIEIRFKDKTRLEYRRHEVLDEVEINLEQEEENSDWGNDE